jgi:succinate dehydrogenase flavin-adding protein (antitoxin of CptAB toxin-antitoxin module)
MESGLHEIDHYLDDFLFAGADKTSNLSYAKYKRLLNARPAGKALAQNANEPHND